MEVLEDNYSLDLFKLWSKDALLDYLRKRSLPITGSKLELAAMAYTAYRMKLPIEHTAVQKVHAAKLEYVEKLCLPDGTQLDDPLRDEQGWMGEVAGITKWPRIVHGDIIQYFNEKRGLPAKEVLNKYKEGKAFSFFSSDFVKEVLFKQIRSDLCLLKTSVTPSQCLNDGPHHVWACTSLPNGTILRAYCTCTAGLGETCNHLAGLLFRIESANTNGLINPTCTMEASQWIIPSSKTVVVLGEVQNFNFVQPNAGKEKSRPLVSQEKRNYQPIEVNSDNMRQSLMDKLSKSKPNCLSSRMYLAENEEAKPVTFETDLHPAAFLTDYIVATANTETGTVEEKSVALMHKLPKLSANDIKRVAILTAEQSNSSLWGRLRKGRITASNFGRVASRLQTLENPNDVRKDTGPILCELMGYVSAPANLPQFQHGRAGEVAARPLYLQYLTEKGHVNAQLQLTGLHIDKEHVFLAVSPDLLVSCDCCVDGLAEIKSPCREGSLPYLNNDTSLKKTHNYYQQIQGQMAVTNRSWCDFVLFQNDKVSVERIYFDEHLWLDLKFKLVVFFQRFLLPEMISNVNRPQQQIQIVRSLHSKENVRKRKCGEEEEAAVAICNVDSSIDILMEEMVIGIESIDSCYCPICKILCVDEAKSFQNSSMQCDMCLYWFHMKCLKMTQKKVKALEGKPYKCYQCQKSKIV